MQPHRQNNCRVGALQFQQLYIGNQSELDTCSYQLLCQNDQYYHLPKYRPFLLNHPVWISNTTFDIFSCCQRILRSFWRRQTIWAEQNDISEKPGPSNFRNVDTNLPNHMASSHAIVPYVHIRQHQNRKLKILGNKMPTRCNRWFLLQILLLAQHVSGTNMPIIRSSRVLYKWLLPVVFGALVLNLSVWCGAEGYVSGLRAAQQAATTYIILSSSWWWA